MWHWFATSGVCGLIVPLKHVCCFLDLSDQIVSVLGIVDQLFVVNLEQHSRDFGSSRWFSGVDKWIDDFAKILLLFFSVERGIELSVKIRVLGSAVALLTTLLLR